MEKSHIRLTQTAIFKSRFGQWYFIDTLRRGRERLLIEPDTVEILHQLLQGASLRSAAEDYGLSHEDLLDFLNVLVYEGVVEFLDRPHSSFDRCFAIEPPLDALNILITNACNLRCAHCYVESGKKMEGELDGSTWIQALNNARNLGVFQLNISGGEPLLHPEFWRIAEFVGSVPTFNANLNTNGTLIKSGYEKRLADCFTSIQVSLDDSLPEAHDRIRGAKGCFEKTIKSIERLLLSGIEVNVGFSLTRENLSSLDELVKLCESIGVSTLNIGLVASIGRASTNRLVKVVSAESIKTDVYVEQMYRKLRELSERNTRLRILLPFRVSVDPQLTPEPKRHICDGDNTQILYIMADGTIMPCDKLPLHSFGYGNVRNQSLLDVWLSEQMKAFKLMNPSQLPKCRDCPYLAICGGACVARAFQMGGSLEAPDWISCAIAQRFVHDQRASLQLLCTSKLSPEFGSGSAGRFEIQNR